MGSRRPTVGRRGPTGRRSGCCPHRQPPTPAEAGPPRHRRDGLVHAGLRHEGPRRRKPRLRFDGDHNTPSWRARQEGAKYLAAGAFLALRNVAAHEDEVTWTEQEALEHLATLSVLARWIEQCTVERAT
ncbi:TIGR02391 family protein [Streptomyces xanthochromogenes]|uniref:TIGR02391 family protein n=1 Tax=Streptomyces xanthochromogenes TaxID=67384 RepID=UPI002F3E75C4